MDDPAPPPRAPGHPQQPPGEPVVMATLVDEVRPAGAPPRTRPRWWTPLAICGISLACFLSASFVMTVVGFWVVHGKFDQGLFRSEDAFTAVIESRLGLVLLLVVPQIALVAPALGAALLSPLAVRQRLGLVRGSWPLWIWFAAAAATPLVGLVSGICVRLLMDESQPLNELAKVFRDHGQQGFLIPLAMLVGVTPAVCEELLFRGYMQTRLTRALGPVFGILLCSLLFAAFHMDLVHTVAVLPLGLFLGWIAWHSGSLFPAMLGHFVNNALSVVLVVFGPQEDPDMLAAPAIAVTAAILAFGATGMAAVCYAAVAYPPWAPRTTLPGKPETDSPRSLE